MSKREGEEEDRIREGGGQEKGKTGEGEEEDRRRGGGGQEKGRRRTGQ